MSLSISAKMGLTLSSRGGVANAISTAITYTRGTPDTLRIALSSASGGSALAPLALSELLLEGVDVLGSVADAVSPNLAATPAPGNLSGVNQPISAGTEALVVGVLYLVSYEVGAQSAFTSIFPGGTSPFPSQAANPLPTTPGVHHRLIVCDSTDFGALFRSDGPGEIVGFAVRKAEWTYSVPANSAGDLITYAVMRGDATPSGDTIQVPNAGEWYVSGTGSDTTGTGAMGSPLRQPSAVTTAQPGDTIWGKDGIFDPFEVTASGTAGNLITYKAVPGHTPIVRGELQSHIAQGGAVESTLPVGERDGIRIDSKDYIRVEGWSFEWVWRHGIFIVGTEGQQHGNHEIVNNFCRDVGRSGIYVGGTNSDAPIPSGETINLRTNNVLVEGNDVTRTNLEIDQLGFGNVEAISVAASASNVWIRGNIVHDTLQYGIDIKAGVDGFEVSGNTVTNTTRHGIYVDAGQRFVKNGSIFNNVVDGCRHGIVIARENGVGDNPFLSLNGIIIYNNTLINVDQIGIYAHRHPGDFDSGEIVDIRFGFNTIYNADREGGFKDINIDGWPSEFSSATMSGNDFVGNLVYSDQQLDQAVDWSSPGWSISENFNVVDGVSNGVDPLFTNPVSGDFSLQAGSPAISVVTSVSLVGAPFNIDVNGSIRAIPASAGAVYRAGETVAPPLAFGLKAFTIAPDGTSLQLAIDGVWTTVYWQIDQTKGYETVAAMDAARGDADVIGEITGLLGQIEPAGIVAGDIYYLHMYAEGDDGKQATPPISAEISLEPDVVVPSGDVVLERSTTVINDSVDGEVFTAPSQLTTLDGADRAMLAVVSFKTRNPQPTALVVNFGAVPMTLVPGTFYTDGTETGLGTYRLLNSEIPTGAQTLSVSSPERIRSCVVEVVEFSGVDQVSGFANGAAQNTAFGNPATTGITTGNADSAVLSVMSVKSPANRLPITVAGGALISSGETGLTTNSDHTFAIAYSGPAPVGLVEHSYTYDDTSGATDVQAAIIEVLKA